MSDQTQVKNAQNAPKPNNSCWLELRALYTRHFPTDKKTYNWRLPFVGLILSILTLDFLSMFIFEYMWSGNRNHLTQYCAVFAAVVVTYELYYGLEIGDRKQFTPWILLKLIEIILTIANIVVCFSSDNFEYNYGSHLVGRVVYGFILLALNIGITAIVLRLSLKQFTRSKTVDDENIYDTYEDA